MRDMTGVHDGTGVADVLDVLDETAAMPGSAGRADGEE